MFSTSSKVKGSIISLHTNCQFLFCKILRRLIDTFHFLILPFYFQGNLIEETAEIGEEAENDQEFEEEEEGEEEVNLI